MGREIEENGGKERRESRGKGSGEIGDEWRKEER